MRRSLLLAALLLPACAPAPAAAPVRPAAIPAAAVAPVKAVARLGLRDAGGRRLLDAAGDLTAWQAADVAHVTLTVMAGDESALPTIKLEGAAIGEAVELYPLLSGRTYSVVGRAYRVVGGVEEAIDAFDAAPATCTTTFTTGGPGVTTIADPLRIQFGARRYAGAGGAALAIQPGDVTDADPTPAISVDQPL